MRDNDFAIWLYYAAIVFALQAAAWYMAWTLKRKGWMLATALGGMAEIFLARESGPGRGVRPVVIKRILPIDGPIKYGEWHWDDANVPDGPITGAANADAAAAADIVIVAVPWDGHKELLAELAPALAGKIVVDCVNPMGFDKQGAYALPVEEGSAAQQAAAILPDSRVVAAFHHVSAVLLEDPEVTSLDTDVLVLGDDRAATDVVRELADTIPGMRGIFAGRLRNAHQVEALTCNLISINRRYKAHSGLRITDV